MAAISQRSVVGWMLRTNRRSAGSGGRNVRGFASEVGAVMGKPVAASQISRWENAVTAPTIEVLRAYEIALGLPSTTLIAPAESLIRFQGAEQLSERPPSGAPLAVHDLIDKAVQSDAMTGEDWRELTSALAGATPVLLHPPRLWDELSGRLLRALTVAEGTEWLLRQEAMCKLVGAAHSRASAISACVAVAADTSDPSCVEPLSLLDNSPDVETSQVILDGLTNPIDERYLQGSLLAANAKLKRGHFRSVQLRRLRGAIDHLARSGRSDNVAVRSLVEQVHARAHRCSSQGYTWSPVQPDDATVRLAQSAQARTRQAEDGIDDRLLHVLSHCLQSLDADERLYYSMVLASTPYAVTVRDELGDDARRSMARQDAGRAAAELRLLTVLGGTSHFADIERTLTSSSAPLVRSAAAWALPHGGHRFSTVRWRLLIERQLDRLNQRAGRMELSTLHALVYSAGAAAHRLLMRDIADDASYPVRIRLLARWWAGATNSGGGRWSGDASQ